MKVVLDEDAYMPTKAHEADAGYDLRTPKGDSGFGRGARDDDSERVFNAAAYFRYENSPKN